MKINIEELSWLKRMTVISVGMGMAQTSNRPGRQLTTRYLRSSELPVALLINFGAPSLEFRRFENK